MVDANRLSELRIRINEAYTRNEQDVLAELCAGLGGYEHQAISDEAAGLIEAVRQRHSGWLPFEAFLQEYSLNSEEGIVLMGIAEALLRIPDTDTQNRFLQEKLGDADWQRHLLHSNSLLVNLASGALLMSGLIEHRIGHAQGLFDSLLVRLGEPAIRNAVMQAMQIMAGHFVLAETIADALDQADKHASYRYSFDMLGEAALTEEDASRYFLAYQEAIDCLGKRNATDLFSNPSISVKLSALYPRYEVLQHRHAVAALSEKLSALAHGAREANIGLTVDAEEADRLDMSLTIFERVFADPGLNDWPGLGLAVQTYQKRALPLLRWLIALAETHKRIIPVRLVKGAYWDSEIKRAQENGWPDYPVFTRKAATDVSYLACARLLLAHPAAVYPQFATHNAHTVAALCRFGQHHPGFEFQRLHGMGEALYDELLERFSDRFACRIYAPVGNYRDLLPYLVRRLLENGANTSFIHQIENPAIDASLLSRDPLYELQESVNPNPILTPPELFGPERRNSEGLNLSDPDLLERLQADLHRWSMPPAVEQHEAHPVFGPFDLASPIGQLIHASEDQINRAIQEAEQAFKTWRLCPAETRAAYLNKTADLLESRKTELLSLIIREGGRTLRDALAEIRETVDLCRYYAANAVELFGRPQPLPGPTGESNLSFRYGRGVFACISPWNFPLAIFAGQIAAALAAGNTVIAKPAIPTCLTAMACIRLFHEAGIPDKVLHFVAGEGSVVGKQLLSDARIAGVAFTGSVETAHTINRQLAERNAPIAALIAETGGQNVMIADSTAHEEQLIADTLQSAFNSAGQRCSALRVLFLPEDTADKIIARLAGAMRLLRVGSPLNIDTDIGPVINRQALETLYLHVESLRPYADFVFQLPIDHNELDGHFFPPTLIEIPNLALLTEEVFGPILHVIRYPSGDIAGVVDAVNATGFGLTLGVHSRINATMQYIQTHAEVGNIYVNRNMIGAVVGAQPFGGMKLSGTGPKAGGPDYLRRFAYEQTVSNNIAAIGGNPWLLAKIRD